MLAVLPRGQLISTLLPFVVQAMNSLAKLRILSFATHAAVQSISTDGSDWACDTVEGGVRYQEADGGRVPGSCYAKGSAPAPSQPVQRRGGKPGKVPRNEAVLTSAMQARNRQAFTRGVRRGQLGVDLSRESRARAGGAGRLIFGAVESGRRAGGCGVGRDGQRQEGRANDMNGQPPTQITGVPEAKAVDRMGKGHR